MKKILFYAVVLFCGLGVATMEMAEDKSPTEQLKPTLDKLITILADGSLKGVEKKKERREVIMNVISERFDFREMSQRILGRTWNSIDDKDRDHFTAQMTKLLENNYIGQLETYSGETLEYVGERIKDDKAQVSTIVESKGAKYPVHYILLLNKNKWMVYDINIEGVSLVRNYRAEFKSIIRKEKFEGLIQILEEKNKSFE